MLSDCQSQLNSFIPNVTYIPCTKSPHPHLLTPVTERFLFEFGDRIRSLRTKRGFSQEEFAARCSLDRTYISGIERGRRNPSLRNILRISSELGVSMSELFKGLK